jgi:ribosome-associated protein
VRARAERLAGKRLTSEGVLIITAQRHRTQERNRQDARERLIALLRQAAVPPVPRRPTRPTKASRERRIEGKKRRGSIKHMRRAKPLMD